MKENKINSVNAESISASDFVDHYKSLLNKNYSHEDNQKYEFKNLNLELCPLDYDFTQDEVKQGIQKLKNGKSSGTDLILNEFIKTGSNALLPLLTKLFNIILKNGSMPKDWNLSIITSLYKNGAPNDANNYRGLSVTSCLGKLFTGILQQRLNHYLESSNLISQYQSGFRKDHRTTDNIFVLRTLVNKYLHKKKKNLYACFVDFSKAFDTVWRSALLYKINKKGIGGNFLKLLNNMYTNTFYSCKKDNQISEAFLANRGVKQGDNLSPTLFNIFIDDFVEYFANENTDAAHIDSMPINQMFFADDLVLVSESAQGLQKCIDILSRYCFDWKLCVNMDKTKVMIFSQNTLNESMYGFYYNHNTIEIVNQYKYLGLVFRSDGKLKFSAEQLSERARKAYYAIKTNIPASTNFSAETLLKLYQSMIIPILTYSSEVWITDYKCNLMSSDNFPFEKTQNQIFKDILGVHSKSSNIAVLYELGQLPLFFKCYENMFKFYKRLEDLESKNDHNYKLLVSAFREDNTLGARVSWHKKLLALQQKLSLTSLDISHKTFRSKLEEHYINKISAQLKNISNNNMGKLTLYSTIINLNEYKLQNYLHLPTKKSERSILTKLRISAHSLHIETGRYSRPPVPRDKRVCYSCKQFIENENHFILYCPCYDHYRLQYNDIFNVECYMKDNPLKTVMNPSNVKSARRLCKFLMNIYELRKENMKII